jgi:tRNA U34 5-methylaminomethyl-2-thiouridine-forming methyltransferase MnmC
MTRGISIFTTKDGSHSLLHQELNETYHSTHGAIQESRHVFLSHGLHAHEADELSILEYGMGTGLNVLLTCIAAAETKRRVALTTLEAFPVDQDVITKINYPDLLGDAKGAEWFTLIHSAPWDETIRVNEYMELKKIRTAFEEFKPNELYDIIYFDAFAPSKQPELWTCEMLEKTVSVMAPGGIFVTYSAMGQLKRDLAKLGLQVETLEGPPGKKEMVRAIKA